jgi:ABC-type branched-subunit amino acid transport system ATPase component
LELVGKAPHHIIRRGIARTFQHLELFNSMTTLDNLLVAQHTTDRTPMLVRLLPLPALQRRDRRAREHAREVMRFLDLLEYEEWPVGALSYGVRKRVDLARSLVTEPSFILLDEPAAGLTHEEMDELCDLIRRIRTEFGTALLIVEHHMDLVMELCDNIVVLNFGEKLFQGSPNEVQENPLVLEAYLGEKTFRKGSASHA